MAKNKKGKVIQFQPISFERYIKERARKLPFGECFSVGDAEDGVQQIIITRQKQNGSILAGFYLVDRFCLGLKDTFAREFEDVEELKEIVFDDNEINELVNTLDPIYAMNLIYGSIEFAEDAGFQPHKNFKLTEYILDDVENLEYLEIEFGKNGRYLYCAGIEDDTEKNLAILEKNLGFGNFDFLDEDEDYEEYFEDHATDLFERYIDKIIELDNNTFNEGESYVINSYNELQNIYDPEMLAFFTVLYIIAGELMLEILSDEKFTDAYKQNPEKAIEKIKTKFYNKNKSVLKDGLSKSDLDKFPIDAIVFNNLVFGSNNWMYFPEFRTSVEEAITPEKNIGILYFDFYAPVLERISFFLFTLSVVAATKEFGYDASNMTIKERDQAIIKTIEIIEENDKKDEYEINDYYKPLKELDLIFEYYPKPDRKELIKLATEGYLD